MYRRSKKPGVLLPIVVALVARCDAHVPFIEWNDFTEDNPFVMDDPEKSTAIYGYLDGKNDVDVFEIQVTEVPTTIYAEVIVPVCGDNYEDFDPSLAVIGPGIKTSSNNNKESQCDVPISVPGGSGVACQISEGNGSSREIEYECFANKSYYQGLTFEMEVTETGTYKVAVWDPVSNAKGDYTLVIGPEEIWGPSEILQALVITPLIRWGDVELHTDCPKG